MLAQPKTLVVDARMIHASGIGTDLQNLLPYLKNDFELILLGDPAELSKFSWTSGLQIIRFTKKIYSIAEQLFLPMVVPACDYFFSPHFNVPMLPVKAKKRIVLIHDVYHLAATTIHPIHRAYARLLLQTAINKSDRIITISEFSRSEIHKYLRVNGRNVHKISLGADHAGCHPEHFEKLEQAVRTRYSLPADFLLFVGNVKPHKNLRNLVIAFSKLQEPQFADLKLVIVGKKDGFITGDKSLFDLVNQLGLTNRIVFTGFVENEHLPLLYHLATAFVFPSLYEGFGLPPLEAMAAGCPTLVSNTASMPEVCQDASIYFNGNNPDEIAAGIKTVLQDEVLRQTMISKGLELVKRYTWKASATALRDIILNEKQVNV
jgi:glycosyltransferase involved in cell wall biosynthesis